MTIKATEIGKTFRCSTGYDMVSNTSLSLTFTHSSGDTFTVTSPDVYLAGAVTDPTLGALVANTYFEYLTTGLEFLKSGSWSVYGTYQDATPKKFYSSTAAFTVNAI